MVPCYQSAYRKLHSTETALCKIHDDLVGNTCHGKASLLVLLDLSATFDTVDHQLLLSDFSDCGVEGVETYDVSVISHGSVDYFDPKA